MVKGQTTLEGEAWDTMVNVLLDAPKTKRKRIGVRVASFACAAGFGAAFLLGPGLTGTSLNQVQTGGSIALVAAFAAVGVFVRQMQSFRLHNSHASDIEAARTSTMTYELGPKVHVTSPSGTATHPWKSYETWGENDRYLWLMGEKTGAVLLDKRDLSTDDRHEVMDRIKKAGLQRG